MPGQFNTDAHLDNLSRVLHRLHKALLDAERLSYERMHGRIASDILASLRTLLLPSMATELFMFVLRRHLST